jgi:outer membrane lipoprotein-sorting protein
MRAPAAVVFVLALACASPAAADAPAPVAAFAAAWAGVDDYTATITVHETDGKNVQDRVYHYAYKKPTFAKIDVVSGPGKGSGAVWTGGDHVRGHMGGFLSGIKQSIPITDPRATSLRGDTIEKASFQSVADDFKNGKIDPVAADATVDGVATDAVTVGLTPASAAGATREVVYLSRATHLPVRRAAYAGDVPVKQEDFSDVKLNPGLTEGDFN